MNDYVLYGNSRHAAVPEAQPGALFTKVDLWIRFAMLGVYAAAGALLALLHPAANRVTIVAIASAGIVVAYGSWLRLKHLFRLEEAERAGTQPAALS